jgi:hypothetical protein
MKNKNEKRKGKEKKKKKAAALQPLFSSLPPVRTAAL